MKKRPIIKKKDVVIPFCEGMAEINLFVFLKLEHSNQKINFRPPVDIGGFENLDQFKKKYYKLRKGQDLKPKSDKDFSQVKFLFVIDNDLEDSKKITLFLQNEGHLVQTCDPNTEGMILSICGKTLSKIIGDKDYRKKCKTEFEANFKCDAHKLKDRKLKEIFNNEKTLKLKLPVLYDLFKA